MTAPAKSVEQLDTRLRELLELAKRAFVGPAPFTFPEPLSEIRSVIASWQSHLGFDNSERKPFWKCVVALDEARSDLALVQTLTDLVSRATQIPPGPLVKLFRESRNPKFPPKDRAALHDLANRLDEYPREFPIKWELYTELLGHIRSDLRAKTLERSLDQLSPVQRQLVDYAAHVEFLYEHRLWNDLYFDALLALLYDLVFPLENESFFKMMQKVVEFRAPTTRGMRKYQDARNVAIRKTN